MKTLDNNMPIAIETVWLEITSFCNLNCSYCYMNADKNFEGYSREQFNKIMHFCRELSVKTIILSGGEPCTHPLLQEFINLAAEQGMDIGIATNGTFFDEELLNTITKYGVFLQVSIDAIQGQHYSDVRGEDLVHKVKDNISRIKNRGIPCTLSCTLTDNNCDFAIDVCEFALQNDIQMIHFGPLVPTLRCKQRNVSFSKFFEIGKKLYHYQLQHYYDIRIDLIEELISLLPHNGSIIKESELFACNAMAGRNIQIDVTGNVRQCGLIEAMPTFNVLNTNIETVQGRLSRSQCLKETLGIIRRVSAKDIPTCRECKYLSICRGSCRACAYQTSGNVYGDVPYCRDIKELLNIIKEDYVSGKLDDYLQYLSLVHRIENAIENPSVKKLPIY